MAAESVSDTKMFGVFPIAARSDRDFA